MYYPMGRETILTPSQWKEGEFPTFRPVRVAEEGPLPPARMDIPGTGLAIHTASRITQLTLLKQILGRIQ